jgi:type VI secretion system protein ImpE
MRRSSAPPPTNGWRRWPSYATDRRSRGDGDDRIADVLEILTSTGKYVWASYDQIGALELQPIEHPRDRIWRPAELDLTDGPTGVVYLPMIYPPAAGAPMTDSHRLGRETDWVEAGGLSCGVGLKCLLIGDELVALGEIETLSVDEPTGPTAG